MEKFILDSIDVSLVLHVGSTELSTIVGGNLQALASNTQTRLKFDSSSKTLTITGTWSKVSHARYIIRALAPVILGFPYKSEDSLIINFLRTISLQPKIHELQNTFNVNVSYKYGYIRVKGACYNENYIQTAVKNLLKEFYGHHHYHVPIFTVVELSPEEYDFVNGTNNQNVVRIAHDTRSRIHFPNQLNNGNSAFGTRSKISIMGGTIYGVCTARKRLIELFPIKLIYDFTNNISFVTNELAIFLTESSYAVHITMSHSPKKQITVRGVENGIINACMALNDLICISVSPIMRIMSENTNGTNEEENPSQSNVRSELTDQNSGSGIPRSNAIRGYGCRGHRGRRGRRSRRN